MKQLLIQLDSMKHDRLKQLQKEKNDILQEIRDLRKKINDRLDQMEKTLVSDVEERFEGKIEASIHLVETVSIMTLSVEKSQKTLKEAININDAEMFVQLKQGKEILRQNESRLQQLSSDCDMQSIKMFPNSTKHVLFDETNLTKDNIFGRISEIIIPRSIEYIGDFDVSLESDDDECDIGDFLLLNYGSIICADYGNNQLKKLDSSYDVIEHIELPDSPSCLCEIDSAHLAVTLINEKKIQFVSQKLHKHGRWFPVGDCCRGIDFLEGQINVGCGGYENEGPVHIEVYDINGGLMRRFYEGLSCPFYIKAVSDGELFVADGYSSKMFQINTHHFSLSEIQIKAVSYENGFCRLGDGQLCIAVLKSNNVVLVSEDGERQQELLTEENDIENACAVCFDKKQARLIISSVESDDIQVFRVVY